MGEFMGYLPMTLIMALSASLFVALVINPVLSARYQGVKIANPKKNNSPAKEPFLKRIYLFLLQWCLRHRWLVVLTSILLLVASMVSFGLFGKGTDFSRKPNPNAPMSTSKPRKAPI